MDEILGYFVFNKQQTIKSSWVKFTSCLPAVLTRPNNECGTFMWRESSVKVQTTTGGAAWVSELKLEKTLY